MEFILTPWKMEFLDDLVLHANNPKIARFLTDQFPSPYTKDAGIKFIKMCMSHEPAQVMAIIIDGNAVGGIGIHEQSDIYKKNMELGYWLSEDYWGKGIVTEAVKKMVAYGFEHFDIVRIFARPFGNNIGSQKVLEKAGFKLEARIDNNLFKNGQMLDELIYAVRRPK